MKKNLEQHGNLFEIIELIRENLEASQKKLEEANKAPIFFLDKVELDLQFIVQESRENDTEVSSNFAIVKWGLGEKLSKDNSAIQTLRLQFSCRDKKTSETLSTLKDISERLEQFRDEIQNGNEENEDILLKVERLIKETQKTIESLPNNTQGPAIGVGAGLIAHPDSAGTRSTSQSFPTDDQPPPFCNPPDKTDI